MWDRPVPRRVRSRDAVAVHGGMALVVVFWGLAFVAIKVALGHMTWITLTLLRFAVAAMPFAVYLAWARPNPRLEKKDVPILVLLGFLGFTGYHLFLNLGETDPGTTAGTSALVIASVPAFIAILAVVLLKERVTWLRGTGIGLAFAGLAVMLLLAAPGSEFRVSLTVGAAWILPSSVFAALFAVLGKPYLRKYGPFQLMAYTLLFGLLLTLPLAAYDGAATWRDLTSLDLDALVPVLFLGLFPTFIAYGLYFRALQKMDASAVGSYVYLSTLVAVVAGIYLLAEPLTVPAILGGLMVVGGVYLAQRAQ